MACFFIAEVKPHLEEVAEIREEGLENCKCEYGNQGEVVEVTWKAS